MTRECKFCTSANPGECFVRYWDSQSKRPFWEFIREQIFDIWGIDPSSRRWVSQYVYHGYFDAVGLDGKRYYIIIKIDKEGTEANIVISEIK